MAKESASEATDLTRGWYRRIYSGFIWGRRINAVSIGAEAWFWRVHSIADDFGNAHADPQICHAATSGRRADVSVVQVEAWLLELAAERLIALYEAEGEKYLHIDGFCARQPAGKNGKRVKRCPPSPWDDCPVPGGIQVNPGESSASHSHSHTQEHSQNRRRAAHACTEPAGVPANSLPPSACVYPTFPCAAGKKNGARQWDLSDARLEEWRHAFPAIDVAVECRGAHAWVMANLERRKTADGMPAFLVKWLSRAQNQSRSRPPNGNGRHALRGDRDAELVQQVFSEGDEL